MKVTKYIYKGENIEIHNLGELPEADVKALLKGYKYDELLEMWFSAKANIGYDIQ